MMSPLYKQKLESSYFEEIESFDDRYLRLQIHGKKFFSNDKKHMHYFVQWRIMLDAKSPLIRSSDTILCSNGSVLLTASNLAYIWLMVGYTMSEVLSIALGYGNTLENWYTARQSRMRGRFCRWIPLQNMRMLVCTCGSQRTGGN